MTEQEKEAQARKERKRTYQAEWQRKNPEKCREYQRRHFEKKVENYLIERMAEAGQGVQRMGKYDRTEWEKRKPDLTGKANPDVRELLFQEGITFLQLGAWVGVTTSTVSLWLGKPLTAERRRRIEDAIAAIRKQRGEIDEQ